MTRPAAPLTDAYYRLLGARIRAARRARGLPATALAERIGFTRAALMNLEAGRQTLAVHRLDRIAKALRVDVTELLPLRGLSADTDTHRPA